MHGGALYTLCDVCAYSALLSILDDNKEAVTHDIHVSVLSSSPAGATITFSAEVLKKGRSVCFIKVTALIDNKTIATATVTKSLISR